MITYTIDRDRRIRTFRYSGIVTDAEMRALYKGLLADPEYDASLHDLVDMRPIERFEISPAALRELGMMYSPVDQLGVPTRLAIVATSDFTYGMARMYEQMRGDEVPEQIQVFRSYEAALQWLQEKEG